MHVGQFPHSSECIRFHVSEKRMRLRLDLGPEVYRWEFNNVGEEVACSWAKEEEKNFHNAIKSSPSSLWKYFLNKLVKYFSGKSSRSLPSLAESQQNKTTPIEINSDEEDFSFDAGTAANPGSIFSSPKKTNLSSK
ncbi:hypothetical protein M9H77_25322 [Catharanthus roseus]|uniref:Uncharacterized protein n=1 Tax=Catharanthus roseus TaxID=4058 RepID=A0ACC0A6U0_CATRO|nr:hypothetical protein M9H77_25322 [Catharanthus roseus]